MAHEHSNFGADLRLLRKHFRVARVEGRRFSLQPRTGDALEYVLDVDQPDGDSRRREFLIGRRYLLGLIGDWTGRDSAAFQRQLLRRWLMAPTPQPGPHYVTVGVDPHWSTLDGSGEGI
jgi:hypothetical protein